MNRTLTYFFFIINVYIFIQFPNFVQTCDIIKMFGYNNGSCIELNSTQLGLCANYTPSYTNDTFLCIPNYEIDYLQTVEYYITNYENAEIFCDLFFQPCNATINCTHCKDIADYISDNITTELCSGCFGCRLSNCSSTNSVFINNFTCECTDSCVDSETCCLDSNVCNVSTSTSSHHPISNSTSHHSSYTQHNSSSNHNSSSHHNTSSHHNSSSHHNTSLSSHHSNSEHKHKSSSSSSDDELQQSSKSTESQESNNKVHTVSSSSHNSTKKTPINSSVIIGVVLPVSAIILGCIACWVIAGRKQPREDYKNFVEVIPNTPNGTISATDMAVVTTTTTTSSSTFPFKNKSLKSISTLKTFETGKSQDTPRSNNSGTSGVDMFT